MTLAIDHATWQHAQEGEWDYWRTHESRPDRAGETSRRCPLDMSYILMSRFGFAPWAFCNQTIIDVGCGPTARLACFGGARIIGIDPLVEQYRTLPGGLLMGYHRLFATPAETLIQELIGAADLVASINCLDHCREAAAVVANLAAYAKPGGLVFLSTDTERDGGYFHPLRARPDEIRGLLMAAGLVIEQEEHGRAYPIIEHGRIVGWQDGWSPDVTAWHWWARTACP